MSAGIPQITDLPTYLAIVQREGWRKGDEYPRVVECFAVADVERKVHELLLALEDILRWADESMRAATSQQEYRAALSLAKRTERALGRNSDLRNGESRPQDGSLPTADVRP